MRPYLRYIFLSGLLFLISPAIAAQSDAIDRFVQMVDSLHRGIVFPHNIGPGIVLTNIGVDKKDKMLVINYLLNPGFVESVVNNIPSENGIAQLLTGYDEIFSISMIEAEAGLRAVITIPSTDGTNKTKTVTIPASVIPRIYADLKNGDHSPLKPYLEMLQSTFDNTTLPLKIVDGIYLINAFVKDKEADWIYQIEGNVNKEDITDAVIQNNRMNLINNLRPNISSYLPEIEV